jgi:hypothetical protein
MMQLPFQETQITGEISVRKFSADLDLEELTWHRDDEDRVVESLGQTDWLIQFENCLPRVLTEPVLIPKGEWHRLLQGTGDLTVQITKKGNH